MKTTLVSTCLDCLRANQAHRHIRFKRHTSKGRHRGHNEEDRTAKECGEIQPGRIEDMPGHHRPGCASNHAEYPDETRQGAKIPQTKGFSRQHRYERNWGSHTYPVEDYQRP